MQKGYTDASYEIIQTVSKSHSIKATELFGSRANAIRKNVTDKKNFMQQARTGKDQLDQSLIDKSDSCSTNEKTNKLVWEEVLTIEQCEEYIKQEHPEYGENLCKAIAMHITDEAIKQAKDKNYRSYLAHKPDERLNKSAAEQQQQWDWMKEVEEVKDKFKSQQL